MSASEEEVARFYATFRERYGTPLLGLRDDRTAAKKAMAGVFPEMPVGEDPQHFLGDLGPVILTDYEPLRQGLVGDDGLANLTKWSHTLPASGWGPEELEAVWVRAALEEAGRRFVLYGEWAEAIWATVARRFEEHGPRLWTEVPGRGTVMRSTVALERDPGADRRRIRHRTGGRESAEEMDAHGALLAFWNKVRCPWFIDQVLSGVNLWEKFARQDPGEVSRRLKALPREARRPRVELRRGREQEPLEGLLQVLRGPGPIEPGLTAWAISVGCSPRSQPSPS